MKTAWNNPPTRRLRCILRVTGLAAVSVALASAPPILEFVEPKDGAEFFVGTEIPVVLRAFAEEDLLTSAEVFADGELIGVAQYCCPLCPCPPPQEGMELTLQIPAPWDGGPPPDKMWQGWTNAPVGGHRLTAKAVSQGGVAIESLPVTISVRPPLRLDLHVHLDGEGVLRFVIPEGSMTPTGFDLELSHDFNTWKNLGPFSPGAIAAFHSDTPDPEDARPRFYRAVPRPEQ